VAADFVGEHVQMEPGEQLVLANTDGRLSFTRARPA
jgi:hypothetical protein